MDDVALAGSVAADDVALAGSVAPDDVALAGSLAPGDVALAGSLAAGDAPGLLGAFDAYADRLHSYAFTLLGEPDAAAGAVLDTLIVAAGSARRLTDRTRLGPWLYALARNECLRRRAPGDHPDLAGEAAELGVRHRLAPTDIAAVLGVPAEDTDRLAAAVADATFGLGPPPVLAVPPGLRYEVAAAGNTDGAARRAELTRRARPFDADGFPVPLDRRRLSGRALAWSAAAVVLIAVGLLVTLPIGDGNAVGVATAAPAFTAATPPAARSEDVVPIPTLVATPFAQESGSGVPPGGATASDRPAQAPGGGGAGPSLAAADQAGAGRARVAQAVLSVTWLPQPSARCRGSWTAQLQARLSGAAADQLIRVQASWTDGGQERTARLTAAGEGWVGELAGLPTGTPVEVVVRASAAGSTLASATRELAYSCR